MYKKARVRKFVSSILLAIVILSAFALSQDFVEDEESSIDYAAEQPLDLSHLEIVNRSANMDVYSYGDGTYVSKIYSSNVNMIDSNGIYRPYEEVVSFTDLGDRLTLEWEDKSVVLHVYTRNAQEEKQRYSERSLAEKEALDFRTNIQKNRGSYYFNHTLSRENQPLAVGYDIESRGVECLAEGYTLICGEQRIDFTQAVTEQNLSVEVGRGFVEIRGEDLSYIDPTVTGPGFDTETYCLEHEAPLSYDYNDNSLEDIGSHSTSSGWNECNGLILFRVNNFPSQLEQSWQIDSVYLNLRTDPSVVSEEGNGATTDFCVIDDVEDYDSTPENDQEVEDIFERIEECSSKDDLFSYSFDEDEDSQWFSWKIDHLDPTVLSEILSNMDGSPDDALSIGLEGERDDNSDEYVDFYGSPSSYEPYITVDWHHPQPSAQTSVTSPPNGPTYSSDAWTANNIQHYIACTSECNYVQYCTGIGCTPGGNYGNEEYVTISSEGTTYFRWRGAYDGSFGDYFGSTQEYIDKKDTQAPITNASGILLPSNVNYTFGQVATEPVQVTLVCSDSTNMSGCQTTLYCIDTNNSCVPSNTYSEPFVVSTPTTSYVRYFSKDLVGNSEQVKSQTVSVQGIYPSNVSISIGEQQIWQYSGSLETEETVANMTAALQNEINSCTADEEGYCDIPITISSDTSGNLNISEIEVYYNVSEYYWNLSSLKALSDYKLRLRANDGTYNSNWYETGEFTIGLLDPIKSFLHLGTTGLNAVIEFSILDDNFVPNNFSFNFDFDDGNKFNSSEPIYLEDGEDVFVIIEHDYSSGGTYDVVANVSLGSDYESETLEVSI